MKRIFLSFCLGLVCLPVHATELSRSLEQSDPNYDTSWYLGANFGSLGYTQSNTKGFSMTDFRLIAGKQLSRAFAVEMHVGKGSGDTQVVSGVPVTLDINNYVAGFLKINATFASKDWNYNRFRLYGMLGGTRVQTSSSDMVVTSSGTQTSVSAGVGMEFFRDNIGVQFGYTRYINKSHNSVDYSLDSLYLGVIYQFGRDRVVNAN